MFAACTVKKGPPSDMWPNLPEGQSQTVGTEQVHEPHQTLVQDMVSRGGGGGLTALRRNLSAPAVLTWPCWPASDS